MRKHTFIGVLAIACAIVGTAAAAVRPGLLGGDQLATNLVAYRCDYTKGAKCGGESGAARFDANGLIIQSSQPDQIQLVGAALAALQASAGTLVVDVNDFAFNPYSSAFVASGPSNYPLYGNTNGSSYNGSAGLTTPNAVTESSPNRFCLAWDTTGRSVAASGGAVASDANTIGAIAAPVYLGSVSGSAAFVNGHIRALTILGVRIPDASLPAKCTVGASLP